MPRWVMKREMAKTERSVAEEPGTGVGRVVPQSRRRVRVAELMADEGQRRFPGKHEARV